MTLNLTIPQTTHIDFTPRISVIGVGGGGTNAVDNMITMGLDGVDFVVANTDAQSLVRSRAERRIQLGPHLTQGLGAGGKPEIGRGSAEEAAEELAQHMDGAHMVFVAAGMGGGTGTGAAPIIARMARERGILTVGVATKPFDFEGMRRRKVAEAGLEELQQYVDTLIVIPNQNLFRMANEKTTYLEAFKMADTVLYMGVRGVTDLIVNPGLINLDFADIRSVMAEMGKAMMGTGEAEGDDRAIKAAEAAISNPLLEDSSMRGAKGVLINISGGLDMGIMEVDAAANRIRQEVDEEANIIFGSSVDESMNGRIRVSIVATGIETVEVEARRPKLVAMGGAAVPVAAPILRPTAVQAHVPMQQGTMHIAAAAAAPAPEVAAPLLDVMQEERVATAAASADLAPVGAMNVAHQAPVPVLASAPVATPVQVPVRATPVETAAPAPRMNLFQAMTGGRGLGGLIRRPLQPATQMSSVVTPPPVHHPAPVSSRVEPALVSEVTRPALRSGQTEDHNLEIPTFLRRQAN